MLIESFPKALKALHYIFLDILDDWGDGDLETHSDYSADMNIGVENNLRMNSDVGVQDPLMNSDMGNKKNNRSGQPEVTGGKLSKLSKLDQLFPLKLILSLPVDYRREMI